MVLKWVVFDFNIFGFESFDGVIKNGCIDFGIVVGVGDLNGVIVGEEVG